MKTTLANAILKSAKKLKSNNILEIKNDIIFQIMNRNLEIGDVSTDTMVCLFRALEKIQKYWENIKG